MTTLKENFFKNRGLGVNPLSEGLNDFFVEPEENDSGKSSLQKDLMTKIPGFTVGGMEIAIGKLNGETIIAGHNEDVYKGQYVSHELLGFAGGDFFFRDSIPGSSKRGKEVKKAKLLKKVQADNAY